MSKKSITIIGAGPAAMMLACSLDKDHYSVSIYEKNSAPGRKFLVAGKGGFNLTHSEEQQQFVNRYTPSGFMNPFIEGFTTIELRSWLQHLGIETYIGTSKRVFPKKGIKPIEVLKAIEKALLDHEVNMYYHHTWLGWKQNDLVFENKQDTISVRSDIVVFALGGGSWRVTGSDGAWFSAFEEKGIATKPFQPSNAAYQVNWHADFINLYEGQALKNCTFSCGAFSRKGEAVITQFGIEGSGVYALSPGVRQALHDPLTEKHSATITIDFKPDLSLADIQQRLENKGKLTVKEALLKKINLTALQVDLLKQMTSREQYHDLTYLSRCIKEYTLVVTGLAPLDEAISTVGGVSLDEVDGTLQLKKMPGYYCLGEMLDWDAPTGGYLLQACFSMGWFLAKELNSQRL